VRIVDRQGGVVVSDKSYLWCGMVRCLERDNTKAASPVSKRFFAQGVLDNGAALHYVTDRLGSVRQLVDSSGQVQAQYGFDPYGNRTKVSSSADADMGFAGLFNHRQTGLDFAVYRAYDQKRGRWLNRDPIGEAGGINLFGYANGNPATRADPSGLFLPALYVGGEVLFEAGVVVWRAYRAYRFAQALATPFPTNILNEEAGDEEKKKSCDAPGAGANSEVPSNVGPGPNAGDSVPAGPSPRPTKEQQDKINEIGNRDGCHTCGTTDPGTKSGNWIGDHQDPTKLNPDGQPQRYYPQCQGCSNEQGGRIRWLPKP
jgi:RHS repeat-associated protein